jgi:hypothetical protein
VFNGSVSESNRQRALFTPATGFEDLNMPAVSPERVITSGASVDCLASCLLFLSQVSPDLAEVVAQWESLSEAIQAGISAMVRAAIRASK